MNRYHSNRDFCRSVPASLVFQARRARICDVIAACVLGAVLGVMMGLGV